MITDYKQTPKQKSVDICVYNIMAFIEGNEQIISIETKRKNIHRRIEKFQSIYDNRSKIRMLISKKYKNFIYGTLERIEYWENEEDGCTEVVDIMVDDNMNNLRYMPKYSEIEAEIKRHPDFSPIFYKEMY